MITLTRTNSADLNFLELVKALDAELKILDGDEHLFYSQLNKTNSIKHVIVAYENNIAVGIGAIRPYTSDTLEVKRMYVSEEHRGKRIATAILKELEKWAKELGYKKCILETGIKQFAAIALYKKIGYQSIPSYGKYLNAANSVCFEKEIN